MMKRDRIQRTNTVCLPTGSGMAADFQNVTIVNICATSGAEIKRDRENFMTIAGLYEVLISRVYAMLR